MLIYRISIVCIALIFVGCGTKVAPLSDPRQPDSDTMPKKAATADTPTPQQIFETRILPIFKSPNPSSCMQCHLAGIDLKNYILPSHELTFQSLRDQGLIDLEQPEKSKILRLIQMGEQDKAGASLIQQKVRRLEYEAFADWIKRSVTDPKMRALPKLKATETAGPTRPPEVVRHARGDRLLTSFENTIWAMRFRCMSCHTEATDVNKKLVAEHGARVAWFKAAGPAATLAYLRTSKLIDTETPERSLLLLKPLNEVKHGGGKKFQIGDQGYKAFRDFLEDYARTSADRYPDAASLPKERNEPLQFGSDLWLKLTETPASWGDCLLQVNLFAWDSQNATWETAPIATSDRVVWGKGRAWQHALTLLAQPGSANATRWKDGKAVLPRGKYLIKVYVDQQKRLTTDWTASLGKEDFAGQAEISSSWSEGYGSMTTIDAAKVKK